MSTILERLNADMASVAEEARRSLVQVHNGRRGAGAGTVWHSEGLIVTNAHVVSGGGPVWVTLADGRTLPARTLALDTRRDVAALAVSAAGLPAVALGDSRGLQPGQWVMAVGHPWGEKGAATAGVVVGGGVVGRRGHARVPPTEDPLDWVLVNLSLRPGNSGGPLVDAGGRMVGINTVMTSGETGMAVPVHAVKAFLTRVLAGGAPALDGDSEGAGDGGGPGGPAIV